MEKWRRVWRDGIVPNVDTQGLETLREFLVSDSPRLVQGVISVPPNVPGSCDMAPVAACAIGVCGMHLCQTTLAMQRHFSHICDAADSEFEESASTRYFLAWFDDAPREVMRREMLSEVALALKEKNHE
jgi:hypothetical protein